MSGRKIFISDVHIGAGRFGVKKAAYPHEWDWLSDKETQNFVKFLEFLRERYPHEIHEIVLIGDIFDNWVFPHDQAPPTMEELIAQPKNVQVVDALNALADKHRLFYVPGNHDSHATREFMGRHFKKITYCPEKFVDGRLVAEHGHRYALFNAPPFFSENFYGLPIGYFISRIEATRKVKTKSGDVVAISAAEVKERYRSVYEDWPDQVVSKPRAVFAELDRLGPIADMLCKHGKHKVCIFGHSHKGEIDKDTWFVDDRIYANTGFWCGARCTFVETGKVDGDKAYQVRLMRWRGAGIKQEQVRKLARR